MDDLAPCPGCHRHVRAAEARCPFCAADTRGATPLGFDPALAAPRVRHAVLAMGAAFALGACQNPVAAVYGGPPPPPLGADVVATPSPLPTQAPIYGLPPEPPRVPRPTLDASAPPPAPPTPPVRPRRPRPPEDFGAPVPAYGVPPPREPTP